MPVDPELAQMLNQGYEDVFAEEYISRRDAYRQEMGKSKSRLQKSLQK